jgi:homospermidine synthase
MMRFNNKVLILGFGAVARSFLPLLLKHVKIPYKNITIIDFVDQTKYLKKWIAKGIKFVQLKVTPQNMTRTLSAYVNAGGLIVDLAWNVDCLEALQWTYNNKVLYVNASVEEWDPYAEIHTRTSLEKSSYRRYVKLLDMVPKWKGTSTAVLDHGANPGLVSHFTKRGLIDISLKLIAEKKVSKRDAEMLEHFVKKKLFNQLAMKLGVKVIHCSERDTQFTDKPKKPEEFVNVWSIEAMMEEAIAPVEMGWGTHEKTLPPLASQPDYGPKNQIILSQMGINTWIRSWTPSQEYVGMIIPHGEAFGISKLLTVTRGKKHVYRPTVLYAYLPSDDTMLSLHELRCRGYELQPNKRVMAGEITSGSDSLGALIMGHKYNSWWTGSILSIEEARRLVPGQNATTIQVAIGVVSSVLWILENPKEGICFPEDLPHDYILNIAKPYLGKFISEPSNWSPLANYQIFFVENPNAQPDKTDPWQFRNFAFKP